MLTNNIDAADLLHERRASSKKNPAKCLPWTIVNDLTPAHFAFGLLAGDCLTHDTKCFLHLRVIRWLGEQSTKYFESLSLPILKTKPSR